jgi:hypothetical protein
LRVGHLTRIIHERFYCNRGFQTQTLACAPYRLRLGVLVPSLQSWIGTPDRPDFATSAYSLDPYRGHRFHNFMTRIIVLSHDKRLVRLVFDVMRAQHRILRDVYGGGIATTYGLSGVGYTAPDDAIEQVRAPGGLLS